MARRGAADGSAHARARSGERPPGRFALLCHGFIGTMHQTPSESIRYAMPPDPRVSSASAASHLLHVVAPHAATGGVDVFVHSWNPLLSRLVDAAYGDALRASLHEPVDPSLHKVRSQALSIGRAALLMRAHERRHAHAYRLALVVRNDLVVGAQVRLEALLPQHVWFALICCWYEPETPRERRAAAARCGAPSAGRRADTLLSPCRISHQWGMGRQQEAEADLGYYVMDWWFAAAPSVVLSWLDIATHWEKYMSALRARVKGGAVFSHYVWPVHVHDMINQTASVRFADLQTALARNALGLLRKSLPLRDCPYATLNGAPVPPHKSAQAMLDLPQREADFDEAGLYFGRFSRRMAPMARMCPYTQQPEPIVCCGQRCGEMTCDAATRQGLNATRRVVESVATRVGRMLNKSVIRDSNFSYMRVWVNHTHQVVHKCERVKPGTVTAHLRHQNACTEEILDSRNTAG
ncbi:hypothetical protein AB1Y20_007696 [Prymnesium parvum]|uniref:Protein xylosyltransferase n=1 Tax=Prymnesium parvum TaxID=97485 RepID=A0AB34IYE4_PRYPA